MFLILPTCNEHKKSESNDAVLNASASQARGPRFETRWELSSFSLKSPDFVPVAPRVAFSGMGQARIENNLFIYLFYLSNTFQNKVSNTGSREENWHYCNYDVIED